MALAKRSDINYQPYTIQPSTEPGFDLEKGFDEFYKIDVGQIYSSLLSPNIDHFG